ncbi:hypothetical protein [Mesorhizobium sp. M0006]|uniref:hypothetical protein n=1 Tax=Mesorhizobium sp. M0006 TaxID=2956838 RepID=UPI00333596A3
MNAQLKKTESKAFVPEFVTRAMALAMWRRLSIVSESTVTLKPDANATSAMSILPPVNKHRAS